MRAKELVLEMIQRGQLNHVLYKYMSLSDESLGNTLKCIRNNELWFSSPDRFNDPFDCAVHPTISNIDKFAEFLAHRQTAGYDPQIVESATKADSAITQFAFRAISTVANRQGICCLSKTKDNILMWSHYADKHKGLCFEFDVGEDPDFFCYPLNVDYQTVYPAIDLSMDNFNSEVIKIFKTKFSDWGYEEEVRICKHDGNNKCFAFRPSALQAIYLGCHISEDAKEKVFEAVSSNKSLEHVKFFQGKENESEFKIDFQHIR